MKYLGIFLTIVILGAVALALIKPPVAGASSGALYIAHGEAVDFGEHLPADPNHFVLFQFTAKWCPGCRMVEPAVADLVSQYDFVERRKIDIESWNSPAAQQMNEYFDASYIPFFALYNAKGDAVALGDFQQIERTIYRLANER